MALVSRIGRDNVVVGDEVYEAVYFSNGAVNLVRRSSAGNHSFGEINPNSDLAALPAAVQAKLNEFFTPEKRDAWDQHKASLAAEETQRTLDAEDAYQNLLISDPDFLKEEIRKEADRRIQVALGARNEAHAAEAMRTGTATATALLRKKTEGVSLTMEEQLTEMTYDFLFEYIRAVKDAQNVLEANLDTTFKDAGHWPDPITP